MKVLELENTQDKWGNNYIKAIVFTMASGGFTNVLGDNGLITYKGIAKAYNTNRFKKGYSIIEKELLQFPELISPYKIEPSCIKEFNNILSKNQELQALVLEFYYEYYYKSCKSDEIQYMSNTLATIMFDVSVLQGTKRAAKTLQRCLNRNYGAKLIINGSVCGQSLKALESAMLEHSEKALVESMLLEYLDNLIEVNKLENNDKKMIEGLVRVNNLRNYCRLN